MQHLAEIGQLENKFAVNTCRQPSTCKLYLFDQTLVWIAARLISSPFVSSSINGWSASMSPVKRVSLLRRFCCKFFSPKRFKKSRHLVEKFHLSYYFSAFLMHHLRYLTSSSFHSCSLLSSIFLNGPCLSMFYLADLAFLEATLTSRAGLLSKYPSVVYGNVRNVVSILYTYWACCYYILKGTSTRKLFLPMNEFF